MSPEQFTILLDSLRGIFANYMNTVWTTMGLFVIAIGWMITSGDARQFYKEHPRIRASSLAALGIILLMHLSILFSLAEKSRECAALLSKQAAAIEGIKTYAIDIVTINWYYPVGSGFINTALAGLTAAIIYSCKPDRRN